MLVCAPAWPAEKSIDRPTAPAATKRATAFEPNISIDVLPVSG
jgi:hypothetical protein